MMKHSIVPGLRSIEYAAVAGSIHTIANSNSRCIGALNSRGASLSRLRMLLVLLVWEQLERGVCTVIVLIG
jgi:hypothetical protein